MLSHLASLILRFFRFSILLRFGLYLGWLFLFLFFIAPSCAEQSCFGNTLGPKLCSVFLTARQETIFSLPLSRGAMSPWLQTAYGATFLLCSLLASTLHLADSQIHAFKG